MANRGSGHPSSIDIIPELLELPDLSCMADYLAADTTLQSNMTVATSQPMSMSSTSGQQPPLQIPQTGAGTSSSSMCKLAYVYSVYRLNGVTYCIGLDADTGAYRSGIQLTTVQNPEVLAHFLVCVGGIIPHFQCQMRYHVQMEVLDPNSV